MSITRDQLPPRGFAINPAIPSASHAMIRHGVERYRRWIDETNPLAAISHAGAFLTDGGTYSIATRPASSYWPIEEILSPLRPTTHSLWSQRHAH